MQETFSWFDVSGDTKKLLIMAAQTWENTSISERYMNQALAKTGDNLDVLVAAYRYFYYKNNYLMALRAALKVRDRVKVLEQLPDDWAQLKPILSSRKDERNIRLFLNAYTASGLVLAKLGEIEQAKEISHQVKEVDHHNEFGAALLLDILTRPRGEEF
jgi:tetratricopeptide (TPR) repeat protein